MGIFDIFKKKAQNAMKKAQNQANVMGGMDDTAEAQAEVSEAEAAPAEDYTGPTFDWDGERLPQPTGWAELSMEDWFYRFEKLRDRMMNIDDENLPEMNDEDGDPMDPEEVLLVSEYGFHTGGHYEKFRNWGVGQWAAQTGENTTDCEFRLGGIARERIMAEKRDAASGAGGALEPVEGVTVEEWAKIQAAVAGGGDPIELAAAAGMDQAKWERVSAEWMSRMETDTTFAVSTAYSNAFTSGGKFGAQGAAAGTGGVGADLSDEPISYELYCEIGCAMAAASRKGQDPNAIFQQFDMTVVDYSTVSQFWSKKTQQAATKYYQLHNEYTAKYDAKYA